MGLGQVEARTLIRRLLKEGLFLSPGRGSHARQEMDNDGLTDVDVTNVLRAGYVSETLFVGESIRYRMETGSLVVVVVIEPPPDSVPDPNEDLSEYELIVVTAWRKKK